MPITHMQHFMLLAKDLEKTRAFYCDVLGLRTGPRPPFKFKGLWIYAGDVACIHVGERASYDETSRTAANPADPVDHGSGSVDHIAFAATDYDELIGSFTRHGVRYRATQVPGSDLRSCSSSIRTASRSRSTSAQSPPNICASAVGCEKNGEWSEARVNTGSQGSTACMRR
jgi:catechol 2,3-dioxygenase-like lactoylglutathione lyase family enzyme